MAQSVQTVLGACDAADLGVALMHEHLMIGWPGWEMDAAAPPFDRSGMRAMCVERMLELKELGMATLVDPCPADLGRDPELMAEVAQAARVNVICATGLYKEDQGAAAYFKFRAAMGDGVGEMTESFVKELTVGIGSTGIKAGIIKVATGAHQVTAYERAVLTAAARAHKATGVPITTHTEEGTMGREQLDIFAAEGVDLSRVIVGHSCGSTDLRYHLDLLDRGAYLGFDRFGLELIHSDRLRLAALIGLVGIGCAHRIVLSHDSVWCWRGRPLQIPTALVPHWHPTHLFEHILPALRAAGVAEETITTMLRDNPRRYFSGASS